MKTVRETGRSHFYIKTAEYRDLKHLITESAILLSQAFERCLATRTDVRDVDVTSIIELNWAHSVLMNVDSFSCTMFFETGNAYRIGRVAGQDWDDLWNKAWKHLDEISGKFAREKV